MTVSLHAERRQPDDAGRTRTSLLRSLVDRFRAAAPEDARTARRQQLGEVCAVLEEAGALVGRGWLQGTWYADERPKAPGPFGAFGRFRPPVGEVTGACLVGAVVHATRRRDPAAQLIDAAPALDVVWDAWQESRGLGGPGVAGRAAPREVRAARIRDLARWNDRPDRTRAEVLGLLDLAASRAIMEAAGEGDQRRQPVGT